MNPYAKSPQRTLAANVPHGTFYCIPRIPTPLRSSATLLGCFVIHTSLVPITTLNLNMQAGNTPNDESLNAQFLS